MVFSKVSYSSSVVDDTSVERIDKCIKCQKRKRYRCFIRCILPCIYKSYIRCNNCQSDPKY